MPVEAARPCLLLSYNDQSLPHEAELQRQRETSHQRAVRAAAEALRALHAQRELDRSEVHHGHEAETGAPAATAGKDSAI
jgi:hypothetical protein